MEEIGALYTSDWLEKVGQGLKAGAVDLGLEGGWVATTVETKDRLGVVPACDYTRCFSQRMIPCAAPEKRLQHQHDLEHVASFVVAFRRSVLLSRVVMLAAQNALDTERNIEKFTSANDALSDGLVEMVLFGSSETPESFHDNLANLLSISAISENKVILELMSKQITEALGLVCRQ